MKPEASELVISLRDSPDLTAHFRPLQTGDKEVQVLLEGDVIEIDANRLRMSVTGVKLKKSPEGRAKPAPTTSIIEEGSGSAGSPAKAASVTVPNEGPESLSPTKLL